MPGYSRLTMGRKASFSLQNSQDPRNNIIKRKFRYITECQQKGNPQVTQIERNGTDDR